MQIKSSVKLNLCLDILKKSASGYHEIQTVFCEVKSLYDLIEIEESKFKDELSTFFNPKKFKKPPTIQKKDNLAFKALKLFKKTYKIKKFASIKIFKNIPVSSGLGGASSNAAATLKGLNKLWKLNLSKAELAKLAAKLGSDVPFFIYGGCALGTHYGEMIKPLKAIKNLHFEIQAKSSPDCQKTANKYAQLDLNKCGQNLEKTKKLLQAIERGDNQEIIKNLHNDFEQLYKLKPGNHLSGAGPSSFSIPSFPSKPDLT